MKIASQCVYTIVHTDTLKDLTKQTGNLCLTEGRPWVTAKELLNKSLSRGEIMFVVFSPAEECYEIIFFAELQNIVTSPGKPTTFYFKNLEATKKPRPLKEELIVCSTRKTIPPNHIKPYVICETPEWLEEILEDRQEQG